MYFGSLCEQPTHLGGCQHKALADLMSYCLDQNQQPQSKLSKILGLIGSRACQDCTPRPLRPSKCSHSGAPCCSTGSKDILVK